MPSSHSFENIICQGLDLYPIDLSAGGSGAVGVGFNDSFGVRRGSLGFDGFNMNLGTPPAGTPGACNIFFSPGGVLRWEMTTVTGAFVAVTDIGVDIGTAIHRVANLFLGVSLLLSGDRGLVISNQTNQAGAGAGTLGNAPAAGNPTFWLPVVVNGVNRAIPCW